jgi:hypothetical protein
VHDGAAVCEARDLCQPLPPFTRVDTAHSTQEIVVEFLVARTRIQAAGKHLIPDKCKEEASSIPNPVVQTAGKDKKVLKQEKTNKEAEILLQRIEKQKHMHQLGEENFRALVDKECPQGVEEARFQSVRLAFQNPSSSEAEADPMLLLDMKSRGFMHFLTRVEPPLSDGMCVIVKGKNGKPCDVVDVCVVACE